ncbi:Imm50 family immunity protein [Streptomyces sp. Ag109_G2-15]|uniref:Imm50 family immunity protein n=1 Tax=Streptomyces sp. Ag109_G2-15 TaxID=1938850 RepID=UPI000BD7F510|nr:Imm50 family immunity protein [Streptomyces sp. Ag109_G2-15]SOD87656.1 Immunity protein 50 [Streptomyces sp. Ag109_G2-15]
MPADTWSELLVHSERLTALYTELPPLEHLVLRSVHLSPYGPGVTLRVELPRFPDRAPVTWTEAGCDRFEAQIEFLAVGEDLRMRGTPDRTVVDIELSPLVQVYERRIRVAVHGAGFSLDFTAWAGLKADHLNAYRSNDADLDTARRWFESRVDQHLHQVLPPTTAKTFYE